MLLVTNDFPPKVGGIQEYLWELWRRLPAEQVAVLTTPHPESAAFDAAQAYRVERTRERWLLPTRSLARRIDALAEEIGASLVVLDPALPLGALGPSLRHPYAVVVHGAEVAVPGRLPGARQALARVLRQADPVIAAGGYVADEAEVAAGRALPVVVVPPGVDAVRFRPLIPPERTQARADFGLPEGAQVVLSLSRLVPRKGMDTLIRAAARLAPSHPQLVVVIAGDGRDRGRLERLVASTGAPVRLIGRVEDDRKAALFGAADLFCLACRNRWGGLEQEGFGIVVVEAAAAGIPAVAGASGGASEAVVDGQTGLIVDRPAHPGHLAAALAELLDDDQVRRRMGEAARRRAEGELSYDRLAALLSPHLLG